jgi:hypothetical protein
MTDEQWERFKKALVYSPPNDESLYCKLAAWLRDELNTDELTQLQLEANREEQAPGEWWPESDGEMVAAMELYARNRGME